MNVNVMYLIYIGACTHKYMGHETTLLEVWVLVVGMSTFDAQTSLYVEDRGIQVWMTLEHGNIVGTQCCDKNVPHLIRPDFPSIETRQ